MRTQRGYGLSLTLLLVKAKPQKPWKLSTHNLLSSPPYHHPLTAIGLVAH